MKIAIKIVGLLFISLLFIKCKSDDNTSSVSIRPYDEVYVENIAKIEQFLKTHSINIIDNNTVNFETTAENSPNSIWNQQNYALKSIELTNDTYIANTRTGVYQTDGRVSDNVTYKMYYLVINEGGGEKPKSYDDMYTKYTGYTLENKVLDKNNSGVWSSYPKFGNALYGEFISGYRQAATLIKTATNIVTNPDGTFTAENPGRIIAFIPSGLAYFNNGKDELAAYQPAIFDITLLSKNEIDHDNDGLLSKYEDIDNDGNLWNDDTDGDKKPNFLDSDDDADGALTRQELTYEIVNEQNQVTKLIYLYNEIPTCTNGTKPKHLDPNCQ